MTLMYFEHVIETIFYRSQGAISKRVEGIYRVERKGEKSSFSDGNKRLLWHGTGVSNLLSILTTGLQVNFLCGVFSLHICDLWISYEMLPSRLNYR